MVNAAKKPPERCQTVEIPVSRSRAVERGLVRLGPGVFAVLIAVYIVMDLNFTPTGVSNRLTEYCLATAMVPVFLAGLALAVSGSRWILLGVWPGQLLIVATADAITLHLGPMGRFIYDTDALKVTYPFEETGDPGGDEVPVYESLLHPAEQMATLLPRIVHTGTSERIEREIMRFTRLPESSLIETLRPFIDNVRRASDGRSQST